MKIQLSEHFSYKKLLKFTLPSIIMMVFTSIYGVVDGLFVTNIVGKTSFAAVNFIMPVLMILGTIGFMFGTGGSALIAKTMGEGNIKKASSLFSLFVYIVVLLGALISLVSYIVLPKIALLLGAEGQMYTDAVLYGRIIILALPFYMLQYEFQSFFVAAEKPKLGLYVTIVSGVTNMILDAVFMLVFKWGLAGAAIATGMSQVIGGSLSLIYFILPNKSILRLGKTKIDCKAIVKASSNGASEFMSNVSMSLVSMLYNVQLIGYAGENGIAAYGTLMYVNMIFLAVFIGYTVGVAPVISYHYGAENRTELKSLKKKSTVIITVFAVLMFVLSELLAYPISYIFVGYEPELMQMTLRGFLIYSFSFLFAGFAIFGSGFFTALNDGLTSALISFLRTLVFQVLAVLTLPLILKLDGIWLSIVVAEVMAVIITDVFVKVNQKKYGY